MWGSMLKATRNTASNFARILEETMGERFSGMRRRPQTQMSVELIESLEAIKKAIKNSLYYLSKREILKSISR